MSDFVLGANELLEWKNKSRYLLQVHECPEHFQVLGFDGRESLSECWKYDIKFFCTNPDLALGTLLMRDAQLIIQVPGMPSAVIRTLFGVVESCGRLYSEGNKTCYSLRLVPQLSVLKHVKNCEIFLGRSVIDVVKDKLPRHGLNENHDFRFPKIKDYPERELITQWQESDLSFVQRLLAEVGIFWCFQEDSQSRKDIVIFQDEMENNNPVNMLPFGSPGELPKKNGYHVWGVNITSNIVSGGVVIRDYNYNSPRAVDDSHSAVNVDKACTWGSTYLYAECPQPRQENNSKVTESGLFYAHIRHERILNEQNIVRGFSNNPNLRPGQILKTNTSLPGTVINGIVITVVRSKGSASDGFKLEFEGIPYNTQVCFRPPLITRPVISGSLPARVESGKRDNAGRIVERDDYAWLDEHGRYRVRMNFDRSRLEKGYAYLWLRLAKPYAGKDFGWHSPLIDGTEVSIMFDGGDPDRPYIAHARHDPEHPDLVNADNNTRNIWRTPANNELRMEDRRGQEHISLSTPYGMSQLNLGYIVSAEGMLRGTGFELRTDEAGAIRAAQGLYLTAEGQPGAQGSMLDTTAPGKQIKQANEQMKLLNNAAQAAGALLTDIQAQTSFFEEKLRNLQAAVVLINGPAGVAVTSGADLQLSCAKNLFVNAGENMDVGVMGDLSVLVKESLGIFAQHGIQMVAGGGDVAIQAQQSQMDLFARDKITVTSSEDEIIISTPKTLVLNGGGSYLKLSADGIEHGSQGDFVIKAKSFDAQQKGASIPFNAPGFDQVDEKAVMSRIGKPLSD